jgi:hypothetical protein
MSEASKYNFPKAEKVQVFEQVGTYIEHNYASLEAKQAEATRTVSKWLQDIHNRYPQASDVEILDIFENGLVTTQQTNLRKWRRCIDVLSVVFAGGVEAIKIVAPALGIPIEVCKRLYEIYARNRKQLPSH